MNVALQRTIKAEAQEPFRWRDRYDNLHLPSEMVTRHLFFTLRMIWNHAMPPEAQTHDYKRYTFDSFYTADYMKAAVRAIVAELSTRTDMMPEWVAQYEYMRMWCRKRLGDGL